MDDDIKIMASLTPNPDSLKFTVDRPVLDEGSAHFADRGQAEGSPLAERIFELEDVTGLFVAGDMITATKRSDAEWPELARAIGGKIREHVRSGEPAVSETQRAVGASTDVERKIVSVLDEIRPYVAQDGGDIVFAGYENGIVSVYMQGACSGCPSSTATLRMGIEQRLQQVVPEVRQVVPIS